MKDYIEQRAMEVGQFLVDYQTTVRQAAKHFGISKSTVHMDSVRLKELHPLLYEEVRRVLDRNKLERHIRGGLATREKYRHLHEQEEKIQNE